MVRVLWVSLRRNWKLEDVQAGLQVIIAVLSCLGIFAFSRFCWQLSSNHIRKNRAVALASLMSINTIGEAFDAVTLLKQRIFRYRYRKILAQSIVVVLLTVSTIVSGPIAKASTRVGTITRVITVPGSLVTNHFNSRSYANVDWNETLTSLNNADFPLNQLIDYLPQSNLSWLYDADQWNSTWSMTCNTTENTPISLYDTGDCTNFSVEFPTTNDFFYYDEYDQWNVAWQALYANSTLYKDGLAFLTGWIYTDYDNVTGITYDMSVTVAAMHMHNFAKGDSSNTTCDFERGQVEFASYTKMACNLTRPRTIPDEYHVAYPDCGDYSALPSAYVANYFNRFATESSTGRNISVITPNELIRFYQTYIVTKDVQYPQPVSRQLTGKIRIVQVSSTFIAFGGLFTVLVILGLFNFFFFFAKNRDVIQGVPESKLDWIVQSILDGSEAQVAAARNSNVRRSVVTASAQSEEAARDSEKVLAVFENAKYGSTAVDEIPLTLQPTLSNGSKYSQVTTPGFTSAPTSYNGFGGENASYLNTNPYESSYEAQQTDMNGLYELQNPEGHVFTADRRRGYQRLG